MNGECHEKCPESYFGNNQSRICEPCHLSCSKCSGGSKEECLECPESRFLANKTDSLIGECKCLTGFFENNEKNCGGIFNCFMKEIFPLIQLYLECHFSCDNCTGPGFSKCVTCAGNRGNEDKSPRAGRCLCPADTYDYLEPFCKSMF